MTLPQNYVVLYAKEYVLWHQFLTDNRDKTQNYLGMSALMQIYFYVDVISCHEIDKIGKKNRLHQYFRSYKNQ